MNKLRKIPARKVTRYRVYLQVESRIVRPVLFTEKQLARLNRLPEGKECFLRPAGCWVIRVKDGLAVMPFMREHQWLEELWAK